MTALPTMTDALAAGDGCLHALIDALEAQVAALTLDAERYVWFSNIAVAGDFQQAEQAFQPLEYAESCTKADIDKCIDAAIAAQKGTV